MLEIQLETGAEFGGKDFERGGGGAPEGEVNLGGEVDSGGGQAVGPHAAVVSVVGVVEGGSGGGGIGCEVVFAGGVVLAEFAEPENREGGLRGEMN